MVVGIVVAIVVLSSLGPDPRNEWNELQKYVAAHPSRIEEIRKRIETCRPSLRGTMYEHDLKELAAAYDELSKILKDKLATARGLVEVVARLSQDYTSTDNHELVKEKLAELKELAETPLKSGSYKILPTEIQELHSGAERKYLDFVMGKAAYFCRQYGDEAREHFNSRRFYSALDSLAQIPPFARDSVLFDPLREIEKRSQEAIMPGGWTTVFPGGSWKPVASAETRQAWSQFSEGGAMILEGRSSRTEGEEGDFLYFDEELRSFGLKITFGMDPEGALVIGAGYQISGDRITSPGRFVFTSQKEGVSVLVQDGRISLEGGMSERLGDRTPPGYLVLGLSAGARVRIESIELRRID